MDKRYKIKDCNFFYKISLLLLNNILHKFVIRVQFLRLLSFESNFFNKNI